jgi:hypothetical protein
MLVKTFGRAGSDTVKHAGGSSLAFVVLSGFIPVGYTVATTGWASVNWTSLISGLTASVIAGAAIFLYNLACTPFRVERERRIALEKQVSELAAEKEALERRPEFGLSIQQIWSNGQPDGDFYCVIAIVSAKNVGRISSALPTWKVIIKGHGDSDVEITPTMFKNYVQLSGRHGNVVTYPESSFIGNQTAEALEPGTIKHGYIAAGLKGQPWICQLGPQHTIVIRCWDIFGNSYEASRPLDSGDEIKEPMCFPGMDQR